ncbi:cadherin-17-like [Stegastes partitus]|uniref:Cadherin-17-like n=1 Tax=Stegastes partitus TaxID=144197 RepID=A0A9Y4NS71_9TELE|nr:PREDICTED: cadherin-17-like [Stegastes partitus]
MTPVMHLLLLPILLGIAAGKDLEDKKGPFENTVLEVLEGTPVQFPIYQFQVDQAGVDGFRLSGEGQRDVSISKDGWLFLERPLDWSREDHYALSVEALEEDEVVEGPIYVNINVVDVNNNAPYFNQSTYTAFIREKRKAGIPFTSVFATDRDDPTTPNAQLTYSLVSQIPNRNNIAFFQIDPDTGEISTTSAGQMMLKAREGVLHSRAGDNMGFDALRAKFNDYCSEPKVPYDQNPFFTCVEKAGGRNVNPLEDPDYTLIVRVQDMGGTSETALTGNARVHIVVLENLWENPGPINIVENWKTTYPQVIAKVQSNEPDAVYSLVQKERELRFPFEITEDGEILLTEELDREEKDSYILVVFAKDNHDKEVEPPMEIFVQVDDENDNAPECVKEESVFEVQEDEPVGALVGQLEVHDNDKEGTLNSQLSYEIVSQSPPDENTFLIDGHDGRIQALRVLQRKHQQIYSLNVRVTDSAFSTVCKVIVKVIDVNNEKPLFEETDYGSLTLAEDTPVGDTVLVIKATDADDPDSGSSAINFHISAGDDDNVFAVETDGKGVGHVVIAKPLDFESSATYRLQIDARNPEPLMKGLEYDSQSTTFVSISVTDVDEVPEFSLDILHVTVPENTTKGSVLLTVEAKDPEGQEIGFKLEGDSKGWLEIDAATGEIKTKQKMDRETLESFDVTVTAFEKANPEMSAERVVHVSLLDVNDNVPKLVESQAFICLGKTKSVVIKATDPDDDPYSQPFSFALIRKSPNWGLRAIDDTTAELILKKHPIEDKTFTVQINIKDSTGMGVNQPFEVRVCNCTELGYCYMTPGKHGFKYGTGATVGILVGILAFCAIIFIIVIKRVKKGGKQKGDEEEKDTMM